MGAIQYLNKTSLKNRIKKAVRKPITYFYVLLILIYAVCIPITINVLVTETGLDSPSGLAAIFAVMAFWVIPLNLVSYTKRKGLIYRTADIHFMFPAPVGPKKVLLYAYFKTIGFVVLVQIVVFVCGIFFFHVPVWKLLLYVVISLVVENVLEASMMILLYGSEKITEKGRKITVALAWGLIAVFALIAVWVYLKQGLSMDSVLYFLHCDQIQMVPLIGWYIGLMHLIFVGPTVVNVIVSAAYFVLAVVLLLWAIKMPCEGEFYEDAMEFAEDYERVKSKQKEGEEARLGKREKFGKASVRYNGGGAKAIFYKQLLEYKKTKLFFLDKSSMLILALSLFFGYNFTQEGDMIGYGQFVIPGLMAYMIFCTSGVAGKWGKELKSPYTFLLPDTPFRKLWYATLWEHAKALVYGILMAVPCGIILQVRPFQVILSILVFVLMSACKLYNTVMTEAIFGSSIGRVGKQLFQMLLFSMVIGTSILGVVVGTILVNLEVGYLVMIAFLVITTIGLMVAASTCFERVENGE